MWKFIEHKAILFIGIIFIASCSGDGGGSNNGGTANGPYPVVTDIAISAATNEQTDPQIINDGANGAIISWVDGRSGTNLDIYAQRVNSSGILWTTNGIAMTTDVNEQRYLQMASDGAGGAIITWEDSRNGPVTDIYAQRVDSNGVVQWTIDGVAIASTTDRQSGPQIISDGSGGAIISWVDYRNGLPDIYAQRVNSDGIVQWTNNGIEISTAAGEQRPIKMIVDGTGGAIIVWTDSRNITAWDIYAQRVNSTGVVQWTADGVAISNAASDQSLHRVTTDGSGGAIISWTDSRSGIDLDIYAQRIDSGGAVKWTADGISISTFADDQRRPEIVNDGAGGAIIAWEDYRSGTSWDIYAQHVDSNGITQWITDGIPISTAMYIQSGLSIISDGAGGAIITWDDYRSGTNSDIYAQRVDRNGVVQWTIDGVAISNVADDQLTNAISPDGLGGAIITWSDFRSGVDWDIYAQGIRSDGTK